MFLANHVARGDSKFALRSPDLTCWTVKSASTDLSAEARAA